MFAEAYPHKKLAEMSIVDLGNAIAHFEEMGFAANDSKWDRYLAGDRSAISPEAKMGAIIFYGRARCAACHSGTVFSDFKYHGVGIFSKIIVDGKLVNDYGRGTVTGRPGDRYKFRTPPLRNVTLSAPYFHDGSSIGLSAAIRRHISPFARVGSYNPNGSFALDRDQIQSISPILATKIALSDYDIRDLIAFLATLESQSQTRAQIIPARVPSGLPVAH
jgi:cytochrome c peroxidase